MKHNIGQLLTYRAKSYSDVEGAIDANRNVRFTYSQLNAQVNRIANWLKHNGIKPKERIALLCQNSIDMMTIFYGAAKIGAVSLPLNVRLNIEEFKQILNDGEPKVLFYDESFASQVDILRHHVPSLLTFVSLGNSISSTISFQQLLEESDEEEPELIGGGDDPFLLIYTSGTTGVPKGVILTHNNLWMSGYHFSNHFDWRTFDRNLIITPMFHISGHMFTVTNLVRGSTSVYADFHPRLTWQVIENERITQFLAVPAMLKLLMNEPNWMERDIDSLRYIICGADSVPAQIIEKCNQFGLEICHGYGCTEFSGIACCWTNGMDKEKKHTVGKPAPFTEIKIVDPETGEELPRGQVGEIAYRGPQMFAGYWRKPEETAKVVRNGWYHSGDMGKMDAEGYLMVVDRLKDMIICAGENIYPAEVEGILLNLEGIHEIAVVGAPDEIQGQIPMAFVVKRPHSKLTKEDILAFCKGRLAAFKCGENVEFIDELPRNSTGKVMKTTLRKMAASIIQQKRNALE
ncbi:Acyl-CoA synthetase (AMP-forming)/AMP-acid ligase II [Seinonella peptonophila]|uniref:Acyl-CoA synthetase (AMP-forming)/AMP-acid ligase II n=1 Tax=Seinonella peptonophila TaxID=112248 RepID=A0A1M5A6A1_9BACL|nr:class I adenylate-forming enzyme family protein [Seinonella peptonophila]SHF25821.1 Acyl-CoA synthetase (AMP-forming)/AMP-acid ligase II [Seinonella peptonophila]